MATRSEQGTSPGLSLYASYSSGPAETYERHFVPQIGAPFAERLLERASLKSGERVLDVACGTGIATRLAARQVGPRGRVDGLDPTQPMIELAQKVNPSSIEWHLAAAESMPLPDSSFDVALCAMGLQFFEDREKGLREMHRVLSPGGRAVTCTPGPTPPLFEAIEGVLSSYLGDEASGFVNAVFALHDPGEVRALFEEAGFDSVEASTGTVALRVAPPADFFWQYVQSTPLASAAARLDEAGRVALEADVVEAWEPFVDGDATVMEPGALIVSGYRG